MQIIEYNNKQIKPHSNHALIITHHPMEPYINDWNYFNYTKPSYVRYCESNNIDLVINSSVQVNNQTDWANIKGRVPTNMSSFFNEVCNKYEYFIVGGSHPLPLLTLQPISFYVSRSNSCDVICPKYPSTNNIFEFKPNIQVLSEMPVNIAIKDKQSIMNYYKETKQSFWPSTGIIANKNVNNWFDFQEITDIFKQQDIFYKQCYHAVHNFQYKLDITEDMRLLVLDIYARQALRKGIFNQYDMVKYISSIDITQAIQSGMYSYLFFGGCGSYSNIWKLRVLMIKFFLKQYKRYIW